MTTTESGTTKRPDLLGLIAIWHFFAAFLWLIGIIAAAIFAFPFSPGYEGTSVEIGDVFGMIVGTLFLIGCTSIAIASGIGLLRGKRWGRIISIVNAALSLLLVPIGTVIGILVMIYLLKAEVREYYENIP
jgi:hypothetical protein